MTTPGQEEEEALKRFQEELDRDMPQGIPPPDPATMAPAPPAGEPPSIEAPPTRAEDDALRKFQEKLNREMPIPTPFRGSTTQRPLTTTRKRPLPKRALEEIEKLKAPRGFLDAAWGATFGGDKLRVPTRHLDAQGQRIRHLLPQLERAIHGSPTIDVLKDRRDEADDAGLLDRSAMLDKQIQEVESLQNTLKKLSDLAADRKMNKESDRYYDMIDELGQESLTDEMWAGAMGFLEWIDSWTGKPGRDYSAEKILGKKEAARVAEDPNKWAHGIAREAQRGNAMAEMLIKAPEFIGDVFGENVLGAFVTGVGVMTDVMAGQKVDWKLMEETRERVGIDTRNMALMMEVDWTMYMPWLWGMKGKTAFQGNLYAGSRANILRSAMRIARKSLPGGSQDPRMGKVVNDMLELAPYADDPNIMKRIVPRFEANGLTAHDAIRAFGRRGEFFGADLPTFLPNEVPILGAVTRKATSEALRGVDGMLRRIGPRATYISDPYVVRKMAQYAYGLGPKAIGKLEQTRFAEGPLGKQIVSGLNAPSRLFKGHEAVFDLFDPDRRFLKMVQRISLSSSVLREDQIVQRFKNISRNAPDSAARRMEIVQHIFDPKIPSGKKALERAKAEVASFRKTLSKTEKDYVDDLENFFHEIYGEAVEAGFLKRGQMAYNPVSGKYYPRLYANNYGLLVELPEAARSPWFNEFRMPTTHPSRKGPGMSVGDLDESFMKAAADPNLAVPQYAAKIARGEAAVWLEDQIIRQFGKEVTREGRHVFGKMSVLQGPDGPVQVPPHLYNFLRGSFDNTFNSLGNFLRSRGGQGRMTQLTIKSLDGISWMFNRWKTGVLVKRLAYHALSAVNDVTMQIADGNINAMGWNLNAYNMLQGGKLLSPYRRVPGVRKVAEAIEGLHVPAVKRMEENVDAIMATLKPAPHRAATVVGPGAPVAPSPAGARGILPGQEGMYRRALNGSLEDKILFIARRYGLPVDVDLSIQRLERVGRGGRKGRAREIKKAVRAGARKRQAEFIRKGEYKKAAKELEFDPLHYSGEAVRGAAFLFENIVPVPGERIARAWESSSKLGHFMWRLSLGDAPGVAVARAFATILDYSNPGKGLALLRWVYPFATWMVRAPKATARIATRNPVPIASIHKAYAAFGSPELDAETLEPSDPLQRRPREYVGERGKYIHLGEFGRHVMGRATYDIPKRFQEAIRGAGSVGDWVVDNILHHYPVPLIGGKPAKLPEGAGLVMLGRDPISESAVFPSEVVGLRGFNKDGHMNPLDADYLKKSVQPLLKGLYEAWFQRSAFTGEEYSGGAGLLPAGFVAPDIPYVKEFFASLEKAAELVPVAGTAARAEVMGLPWFTKHALPFIMANPNSISFLNSWFFEEAGGAEAAAVYPLFGGERPYVRGRERKDLKQQFLGLSRTMPFPVYMTLPGEEVLDARGRVREATKAARKVARIGKDLLERED